MKPGCYPASVTPMDPDGEIDAPALARLLAWFESLGCPGVVLAGTTGEGPSLSAVEKRDLLREVFPARGKLDLVLGVATDSLSEAIWSCRQAAKIGAAAALVMPPCFYREAAGVEAWFEAVLEASGLPVVLYNFPSRTGIALEPDLIARLARHELMAGVKDSSGDPANLAAFRAAAPDKALFVGDESLLIRALEAGWRGTISGAANVLARDLQEIARRWDAGDREAAETRHRLILPAIQALRSRPQPATSKALLVQRGLLPNASVRLPLRAAEPDEKFVASMPA